MTELLIAIGLSILAVGAGIYLMRRMRRDIAEVEQPQPRPRPPLNIYEGGRDDEPEEEEPEPEPEPEDEDESYDILRPEMDPELYPERQPLSVQLAGYPRKLVMYAVRTLPAERMLILHVRCPSVPADLLDSWDRQIWQVFHVHLPNRRLYQICVMEDRMTLGTRSGEDDDEESYFLCDIDMEIQPSRLELVMDEPEAEATEPA